MNHLSHLFLSGDDPQIIIGNFITDFLSPSEQRAVSYELSQGIRLHLFIDHTIDHDPVFLQSIQLIRTSQGRYAPVVADIFYDYLLVQHWIEFSNIDFFTFKSKCYSILLESGHMPIPDIAKQRVFRMVENDFLSSYLTIDFIPQTFSFIKKRAKFQNYFDQALEDFKLMHDQLDKQFLLVFPMMMEKTNTFRINLQNSGIS